MKVLVDVAKCQGHARCVAVAPDLFTLNDDGFNDQPEWPVPPGQEALATRAVRACPERVLSISED
jgi:ferredoxin